MYNEEIRKCSITSNVILLSCPIDIMQRRANHLVIFFQVLYTLSLTRKKITEKQIEENCTKYLTSTLYKT